MLIPTGDPNPSPGERIAVQCICREIKELPRFSDVRDNGDLKKDEEPVQVSADICE